MLDHAHCQQQDIKGRHRTSMTPQHLPDDMTCTHGLVEPPAVCPECCRERASNDHSGKPPSRAQREEGIEKMLCACEAMLPDELRPRVREEAANGNWYALLYVTQYARARQIVKQIFG